MCMHEHKTCPRCSRLFECKVGTVTTCQCFEIRLTIEERAFIEDMYDDCLCTECLTELRNRYVLFKEKFLLK
jgi:cysteine-rich CWC protein